MDMVSDAPLPVAHSQFVRSDVVTFVTCSAPVIVAVELTETEAVVVPPGPGMLTASGFGENVRLCAAAVSGLPNRAQAASAKTSAKRLNLSKVFSPDGTAQQHALLRLATEGPSPENILA